MPLTIIHLYFIAVFCATANCYALNSRNLQNDGGGIARIAIPDQFPFQVAIFATTTVADNATVQNHSCDGSIITNRWILSVASCVEWFAIYRMHLVLGGQQSIGDGVRYDYDEYVIHPEYLGIESFYLHNIALIRTNREIQFTANIQPISLFMARIDADNLGQISTWVSHMNHFFFFSFCCLVFVFN